MDPNPTHMTRITRALASVTSIFRCRGLDYIPPNADNIGGHDLFYWPCFLALLSAWFLFVYMPQCRRNERLSGKYMSLTLQAETDKRELARLQRGISSLRSGDSMAWERAARERLGWLEPGEVLDVERWRSQRRAVALRTSPLSGSPGARRPGTPSAPPPMLPRPQVPRLPRAPAPPTAVAQGKRSAFDAVAGEAPLLPPPLPPLPSVPLPSVETLARRSAVAQGGTRPCVR